MPYVRKRGSKWQAIVRKKGRQPRTRTFLKKGDATTWATQIHQEMDRPTVMNAEEVLAGTRLADLLKRYRDTVTPTKRSQRVETYRIDFLLRQPMAKLPLTELSTGVFAAYRDKRLKMVGRQRVLHELNTLSVILRTAKLDWDVPLPSIYLDEVRKPKMPPPRSRRLERDEWERFEKAASEGLSPYILPFARFALETAMRRGEIIGLTWKHIHWGRRIAHLPITKNGSSRDVPLSEAALLILREQQAQKLASPFPYHFAAIRHAWDKACDRAEIEGLHFHDLRHEAISRLFERGLSIPEVGLISGHKDFRMLARYTHLRADDLVGKV